MKLLTRLSPVGVTREVPVKPKWSFNHVKDRDYSNNVNRSNNIISCIITIQIIIMIIITLAITIIIIVLY